MPSNHDFRYREQEQDRITEGSLEIRWKIGRRDKKRNQSLQRSSRKIHKRAIFTLAISVVPASIPAHVAALKMLMEDKPAEAKILRLHPSVVTVVLNLNLSLNSVVGGHPADAALDGENGLICRRSEIQESVVQPRVLLHSRQAVLHHNQSQL